MWRQELSNRQITIPICLHAEVQKEVKGIHDELAVVKAQVCEIEPEAFMNSGFGIFWMVLELLNV